MCCADEINSLILCIFSESFVSDIPAEVFFASFGVFVCGCDNVEGDFFFVAKLLNIFSNLIILFNEFVIDVYCDEVEVFLFKGVAGCYAIDAS